MKIKLMDIVIDPSIQVREVESFTVSQYAEAMRSGANFPPLIVEHKTNRLICGNHRFCSYKVVFEPDYEVECEIKKFKNDAEIIRLAAMDNVSHGRPLDTFDKKRIALRLASYGDKPEDIAQLLSVQIEKIKTWAGMTVVVIGKTADGKQTAKKHPMKHGFENVSGQTVTEEQYEEHKRHDYGIPAKNIAAQLTRIIRNGWIDLEDERTMLNLKELSGLLNELLKD